MLIYAFNRLCGPLNFFATGQERPEGWTAEARPQRGPITFNAPAKKLLAGDIIDYQSIRIHDILFVPMVWIGAPGLGVANHFLFILAVLD